MATGFAIDGIKFAVQHCRDTCKAAKQFPEELARIQTRLAYLEARLPKWSNLSAGRNDDPACHNLLKNLHDALMNLSSILDQLIKTDKRKWRSRFVFFFVGKNQLEELLKTETMLENVLHDMNIYNTSFIANYLANI